MAQSSVIWRGFSPPKATPSTIRPLAVYAAARDEFEICAPAELESSQVIEYLFRTLPLAEHGWKITNAVLRYVKAKDCGKHWMLRKGPET